MPNVLDIDRASMKHRSPFRYPGGKSKLVPIIRSWIDSLPVKPTEFAETFAGGASVGLALIFDDRIERLILVEKDEDVAAVWRVILNGKAEQLADRILEFKVTPAAVQRVLAEHPETLLDRAFATIIRNRMQRGGIMAPGATLLNRGEKDNGLNSRWYPETLRDRILEISARRDRIEFVPTGDGIAYIEQHARQSKMAFFIDPPYMEAAHRRLYRHSTLDHDVLFKTVAKVKGYFLMTYNDSPIVRAMASNQGFDVTTVAMRTTFHKEKTELLIGRDLRWTRKVKQQQLKFLD